MKKLALGLAMFAIGAIGFILSLEFATCLCQLLGVVAAAKCLIATAVFLMIAVSGGLITNKEIFVEA